MPRYATLDPRDVLRWAHAGRLVVVTALFLAAVSAWTRASQSDTRVVAVAFALAAAWTAAAWWRVELQGRTPGRVLLTAQAAVDLVLATATVHVTGGGSSQFTPLYILVIATAALLLPAGGGLATAVVAGGLHALDVLWLRPSGSTVGLWLQVAVFAIVGTGAGYVGGRLRQAGAGGERLAAALTRARVEAADILRNIRSGIVTVDAEGRLLYANPAASALLHLDLAARLGHPVVDAIAAVAPELAAALVRAAARGERTTRSEGVLVAGGTAVVIGVTTTVSDPQDGEAGSGSAASGTAIFSDITSTKRLEALHLRAQRLEAVAELSASLAHEIKNPLAAVRSAVEQLATLTTRAAGVPLPPEDADDVRTLAGLTVRESDRLSRLLSEFLDFARARVTRVSRVDAAAVAREAARLAAAHPDAAGVRITVDTPEAEAPVDGDAELLHRALFNLALNAAQAAVAARGGAARGGGRVRLEVHCPDAAELPGGLTFAHGAVAVHVSDDGAGIAPEALDRLFDPFFTTRAGGSGLGLAMVQRAAEAHRGVVLVEAGGQGPGARFTVLLPRAAADAEPGLADARPYRRTPARALQAVA